MSVDRKHQLSFRFTDTLLASRLYAGDLFAKVKREKFTEIVQLILHEIDREPFDKAIIFFVPNGEIGGSWVVGLG